MKFFRLSLNAKLAAINLLLACALLAVVAVAWRHLPSGDDAAGAALLSRAQRSTQNADMMHDALHSDVLAALLASQTPSREREHVQQSLRENAREFRAELAALRSMPLESSLKPILDAANQAGTEYVERAEGMGALALSDAPKANAQHPAFDQSFETTKQALAKQMEQIAQHLDAANAEARRASEDARRWLLAAALATVIGGWIGVAAIARSIRRSLTGLRDVARDVAAGNLERRSELKGRDEVGELAASVNQKADTLHQMIERMRSAADRGTFGSQLVAALDMADSEPQALAVVQRAMGEIAPGHAMELLLAGSSDAHLERAAEHPQAGAPGCGVDSPFACVAVRRGHAVRFDNSEALDACPKLRGRFGSAVAAHCVPVSFMGRALGVLHASGPVEASLPAAAVERLVTLGTHVGGRIGTVRAFARTQLQASTDALTGLHNRRSVEARMHELARARQPSSLVMADLDHFKRLNDTHGHPAGDEALRAFADVVRENMRHHDLAGRWGGEEFAFVLVHADAQNALQWAERLRERLALALQGRSAPSFTASFGVAESSGSTTIEALVAAAGRALYQAKAQGRDRAVLAATDSDDVPPPTRHSEAVAAVDVQQLAVTA